MPDDPQFAAARLCATCGMCCDGVLFHSVVLQPGDSARALSAQGLKIKRKKGAAFFLQPCAAHHGSHCAIYGRRPARCRLFQCRQLQQVSAGKIDEAAALEKISEARTRVRHIRSLMRRIGETNPRRPLAQRYANLMTDAPPSSPSHAELRAAMRDLEALLEKDFRMP